MAKMYDKYNRFTKKAAKIVVKLLRKANSKAASCAVMAKNSITK